MDAFKLLNNLKSIPKKPKRKCKLCGFIFSREKKNIDQHFKLIHKIEEFDSQEFFVISA